MISFLLGISITINVILVLGLFIYLKVKKSMKSLGGIIENEKEFKDFFSNRDSFML